MFVSIIRIPSFWRMIWITITSLITEKQISVTKLHAYWYILLPSDAGITPFWQIPDPLIIFIILGQLNCQYVWYKTGGLQLGALQPYNKNPATVHNYNQEVMKVKRIPRYECNCCLNNRNYCPIQSLVNKNREGGGAHTQLTLVM